MRRKLVLGLIETDAGIQFVDIDQKTIGYHDRNRNKITFKYVAGKKRAFAKSLNDGSFNTTYIEEEKLYFFPNGRSGGVLQPEGIRFIFGLCHLVKEAKIEEFAGEIVRAEKLKKEKEALTTENTELKDDIKKLQKQMSMMK